MGGLVGNNLLDRLAALDTCAVSDALDKLGLQGVLLGLQPLSNPRRMVGRVITVKLEEANGRPSTRHLGTLAVDSAQPGDVILVAHAGRPNVSGWGGILSQGAVKRGVAGVIVDGACRDVDESRELGLTLYARNAVPITARSRVIETAFNEPVLVGGDLTVSPGDLVIADGSGIVFLESARAEEIITTAEQIARRERAMAEAVLEGRPMVEVMGANYENLLNSPNK
jgi:4-hydroxy-4-methyl-2-oxoglutarate aldolase